ncbi:MYND finger domain containing protein [Acanthamoeba castellanii str. Neff]|uniref:MYND finger domain containing protein n=1 Tax=Acanthamoeba castellanii (strain ATCC 30010 / Neff) TaxID=1257118 RepID=L8GMZ0_ACACF|nr:MYND finger domain containing protein [Acanthamoeba castellanii str. Neff]ELR14357.1 MYND finger domain containing protein [Acanthamoeba castellanii str. Neff]
MMRLIPNQMAYLRERNEDGLLREAGIGIKSVVITNGGTAAGAQEAGAASDASGADVDAGAEQAETMGRGMFALRDFKAGDVILEESPLAFAPRDCVVAQMLHCSQCLRKLAASTAAVTCPHCRLDPYCSDRCAAEAWESHHRLLCEAAQADPETTGQALRDFNALCREQARAYPLLIARLIAQLSTDVAKLGADVSLEEALDRPNGLFSHLRHFCSADIEPQGFPPEFSMLDYIFGQTNLASHILSTCAATICFLDPRCVLVDEHFCFWLFTILMRNTFGLWIVEEGEAEGVYTDRREDGVALFLHASYFNHSCTPNVDRCNRHGDKRVAFIACADIKKGEQLFIEYVDTRAPVDERRQELAQRYGFLCSCPKCSVEATAEGTTTTQ